MDWIIIIIWLILGTALFGAVHKAMDITYFGLGSICNMWFWCQVAVGVVGYFAVMLIGGVVDWTIQFVSTYYKWIISGGIVLLGLFMMGGNKSEDLVDKKEKTVSSAQENQE